jgi:hypothetical protein
MILETDNILAFVLAFKIKARLAFLMAKWLDTFLNNDV